MRKLILTLLAVAVASLGTVGTAHAAKPHPPLSGVPIVQVDTTEAGRLPVSKAISSWNAGLTAFQLEASAGCSGPRCIHVREVFDGPTFLCTNPYECGSSGGLRDGSCTVEVDRGNVTSLPRYYGQPQSLVLAFLMHGMGHAITGTWSTDGSMGFDCNGLSHDNRGSSVMCSPAPYHPATVPDAQNYAEADAAFRALYPAAA